MNFGAPPRSQVLPLRSDLQLYTTGVHLDGSTEWTLYDPVGNHFFRLGIMEYACIQKWELQAFTKIVAAVNQSTTLFLTADDLKKVHDFLEKHHLLMQDALGTGTKFNQLKESKKTGWGTWLIHHYLYIRLPLFNPDQFLAQILQYTRWIYTPQFWIFIFGLLIYGANSILKQWDQFSHTMYSMLALDKWVYYVIAIGFAKMIHELGHGLTAKYFGLRVPSMGIAFLVMAPLFYTDVTDSWRLSSPRKRACIAVAGIGAETILTAILMFFWPYMLSETAKGLAFLIIVVNWIATLAINLNPLMRFDGYHLLADILNLPNLQERAFALGIWRLRHLILGIKIPVPEHLPRRIHNFLILYAYSIWLYRFTVFIGIAVLVYYMFFKALGLILFIVEMYYFVAGPIVNELKEWWALRPILRFNRHSIISLILFAMSLGVLCIPWQSHISMPAVMISRTFERFYPVSTAKLDKVYVQHGDIVEKDQELFTLISPDLEYKIFTSEQEISRLQEEIDGKSSLPDWGESGAIVYQQLTQAKAVRGGLLKQKAALTISAPYDGIIVDTHDEAQTGIWLNSTKLLGTLISPHDVALVGYAAEDQVGQIADGTLGTFVPEHLEDMPVDIEVKSISKSPSPTLEFSQLNATHGGTINISESDHVTPLQNVFRIDCTPRRTTLPVSYVVRGHIRLQTPATSLLRQVWTQVVVVVLRESGF